MSMSVRVCVCVCVYLRTDSSSKYSVQNFFPFSTMTEKIIIDLINKNKE
jgi:hypothetical protein